GKGARSVAGLDGIPQGVARGLILAHEVVRPDNPSRGLVEREELFVGSRSKQPFADQKRRRMRTCAVAEVHRCGGGRVLVLPKRAARRGLERYDNLLRCPLTPLAGRRTVDGEEPLTVCGNRGLPLTKRSLPQSHRTIPGPGGSKARRVGRKVAV